MSDTVAYIEARLREMERIGGLIQRSSLGSDGEVETLRIARGLREVVELHGPPPSSWLPGDYCRTCGHLRPCRTVRTIAAIWPAPAQPDDQEAGE